MAIIEKYVISTSIVYTPQYYYYFFKKPTYGELQEISIMISRLDPDWTENTCLRACFINDNLCYDRLL